MSEVKWIKINIDMFDDEKIKIIQAMPEGDSLLVVWIKLITLAGKTNDGGYIYIAENMPYTEEMLSVIMNKPINIIRLAISTFKSLKMIESDTKGIYLVNFEKHQSLDKLERLKEQNRERVARHREKKKLESGINYCAYCGEEATGIDHIIPTSRGGSEDEENKVSCCIRCNKIKNDKPLVDFLNANRDIIKDNLIKNNEKLNKYVMLSNVTDHYTVMQSNGIDKDIDKELDKELDKENNIYITFGEYKRIKLTQKEYNKLVEDYDKLMVDKVIEKLDEYVESNNNKNKYKNFNLVVRKAIKERWFVKAIASEPSWLNENIDSSETTSEEKQEMEELLREYR